MIHFPGEHPETPGDLARRQPLLAQLTVGTTLYRLHARDKGPLYLGKTGGNRFDSQIAHMESFIRDSMNTARSLRPMANPLESERLLRRHSKRAALPISLFSDL